MELSREEIKGLKELAPKHPWKAWNGYGPCASDGLMRAINIGPVDGGISAGDKRHDVAGTKEDIELVCYAVNNLEELCDLALRAKDAEAELKEATTDQPTMALLTTVMGERDEARKERDQLAAQVGKLLDALKDVLRRHRGKHDPDEFVAQAAVLLDAPQCLAELEDRERLKGAEAAFLDCAKLLPMLPFDGQDFLTEGDLIRRDQALESFRARLNGCAHVLEMEVKKNSADIVKRLRQPKEVPHA